MSMTEDDRLQKRIQCAIQQLSHFVVPLYLEGEHHLELLGTGFFVQFDDTLVLVSAAHVLCQASDYKPLFAFRSPKETVRIGGRRYLSPIRGLDLGFIVTEGIEMPWKDVEKVPCLQEYLVGQRTPRANRLYAVAGYPASKNKYKPSVAAVVAEVHSYHSSSIPDDEYAAHGLDPLSHIAIPLDLRRVYGADHKRKNFPWPQGMSGSPIWELFHEHEIQGEESRTFPIVGVATDYRKESRLLFGTDIAPLLEKIHNAF